MSTSVVSPTEEFFPSSDGLRLFYRRWEPPAAKALCLLVHGLAEHSGRYRHVGQFLAQRGLSVWALDHRGHGRSQGRRGDCRGLRDFLNDLDEFRAQAQKAHADLPLVLVGHSLGGLIALSYAAQHPAQVKAVAVSSPALKLAHETPPWKVALVTAVSRGIPTFPFQNGVNPKHVCRDPSVVEAYKKDPLVHRVITARCALSLRDSMRQAMELAEQLRRPTLLMQAGNDEVCDAAASEEFARRFNGSGLVFKRFEGFYHELFNEPERMQVLEFLGDWLDSKLRG